MPAEAQLQISISFSKNGAIIQRQLNAQFDVAGSVGLQNIQNIGTTDETLTLGDVATNGFLLIHNLDATNYITFGSDGSSYPIKLKATEFGLIRFNGAAIHAKANTAACDLEYILLPD
jgi:hypothetical protein